MGTQFKNDCPHCLTKASGFSVVYQWRDRGNGTIAFLTALCGVCNNGILIRSKFASQSSGHPDLVQYQVNFPSSTLVIQQQWPSQGLDLPSDLPPNVEGFYRQGLESLNGFRWDAAGAMFRKSLDVATKIIAPAYKTKNLYQRIESLVADGLLTDAMGEWSHEIRIDGNDAVHDEELETEADARALQKFTEALLTYAFSLPSMVARNRAKRDLTGSEEGDS